MTVAWRRFFLKSSVFASSFKAFLNRFSVYSVIVRGLLRCIGINFRLVLNEGIVTSKYLKQYEKFYWQYLVKIFYKKADAVIVPTKAVGSDLHKNFGVPGGKIKIIPSWVPENIEKVKKIVKKYDGIYVGRISPEKGMEILVDLAVAIKRKKLKFKMAIVGEGVMLDWLKAEVKRRSLENILVLEGFKTHEEALDLIAASKVFLLPSSNEGLPMTVLEANALGVPAVVLPFLGADEVVNDGKTGIIVDRGDYIKKVLATMEDDRLIERMAKEAINYVKLNHSRRNLEAFISVIFDE